MNQNKKLYSTDEFGNKKEYDVILTFHNDENENDYVVYTDNKFDAKNKLKIFASKYDPFDAEYLGPVETKEEWEVIYDVLKKVLNND